jgi:glycosyltransferase involved in cell wall biosynthesis
VIFSLGRFIGIKGFDDLLRAFARLPSELEGRPLFLVVAGEGPLAQELAGLARTLGMEARVKWPGWVDRPGRLYALSEVFVCPSRHETLGNVILEAWTYGRPVVATDTPGATELVADGRTGLLAPRGEPERLAERLSEILTVTTARRQALGASGREEVSSKHGREAIVSAYIGLYGQLVAERSARLRGSGGGG